MPAWEQADRRGADPYTIPKEYGQSGGLCREQISLGCPPPPEPLQDRGGPKGPPYLKSIDSAQGAVPPLLMCVGPDSLIEPYAVFVV